MKLVSKRLYPEVCNNHQSHTFRCAMHCVSMRVPPFLLTRFNHVNIYIYIHTNANWLHCTISSLALRYSVIKYTVVSWCLSVPKLMTNSRIQNGQNWLWLTYLPWLNPHLHGSWLPQHSQWLTQHLPLLIMTTSTLMSTDHDWLNIYLHSQRN